MSRRRARGRHHGGHEDEGGMERWLLTYADMITLLMALFMVLFSISSVNISKYEEIQRTLRAAFSGNVLPGGKSIARPGASSSSSHAPTAIDLPAVAVTQSIAGAVQGNARTSQSASVAQTSAAHQAAQQEPQV